MNSRYHLIPGAELFRPEAGKIALLLARIATDSRYTEAARATARRAVERRERERTP